MYRRSLNAAAALFLVVLTTFAQQPVAAQQPSTQSFVFNLEIFEFNGDLAREIERLSMDRPRLERMIADGKVRPIADLLMRTRSGETGTVRAGQRFPIQSGPGVQYENTGTNVDLNATLLADGKISVGIKIEMTSVARGALPQYPVFTIRTLSDRVQVKPNERAVVTSFAQHDPMPPGSSSSQSLETPSRNLLVVITPRLVE